MFPENMRLFFLKWISPFVLLWVLWEALSLVLIKLKGVPFPTLEDVVIQFFSYVNGTQLLGNSLWQHTISTMKRWLSGYVIGIAIGMMIGVLCAMFQWLTMVVYPIVVMLQMVPGLAWIPVAILIAGIGDETAVLMIVLTTFAPIAMSLMDGVRCVPDEYVYVSRMCEYSRWRRFFCVQLPSAFPMFITGMRLALANSWRVVVAAEMVIGAGTGLGYAIFQSRWDMNYEAAFVCIGVIVFIGLIIEKWVLGQLEAYTIKRWGMLTE